MTKIRLDFDKNFLCFFMAAAPLVIGIFYEWLACIASVVLIVFLIVLLYKNRKIKIGVNLTSVMLAVLPFLYLITGFWAVDRYYAIFGFLKYLPLIFFFVAFNQYSEEEKDGAQNVIPLCGAIMTVLSLVLGQIDVLEMYFFNGGRLAGFFQYANVYALFLLLGLIITAFKDKLTVADIIISLILIAGIILSGSRTVFVLTFFAVVLLFITRKNIRKIFLFGFAAVFAVAVIYVVLTKKYEITERFLTINFSQSTLLGRFLYYKDALKMIIKHPFGMGYMGFFYAQTEYQTGLYLVKHVHNDVLQLMLDIGIVPGILFVAVIFKNLFSKSVSLKNKFIILFIFLHCLLDFDLQYVSVFFVLITALREKENKEFVITKKYKYSFRTAGVILSVFNIFFASVFGMVYFKNYEDSFGLYSKNTEIELYLIQNSSDAETVNLYADKILSHNKNAYQAYDAKALVSFKKGDLDEAFGYKKQAIEKARYNKYEYSTYYDMLKQAIESTKDKTKKAEYIKMIKEIPEMIRNVLDTSDELAFKITNVPDIELSKKQLKYINSL